MGATRSATHARYGRAHLSATPEQFDIDSGFAYVKGLMAPWLMATGLTPDRAWDLARRVEDDLAGRGHRRISLDELRGLAHAVLGEEEGDETAERFRRWHDFERLDRTLVVLIGGATGVGKSTIATQLALHLGITRVSSTDFIRQVLRSVVPDTIAPELSRSSFELDREPSHNGAARHADFERQAQQVLVGVRATIERAALEGTPLIVEGIHLFPGLVDVHAISDSLVVHVVLAVDDEADHAHRFALRAGESGRTAERYDDGLDAIRELQEHVVATARRTGIPVVENRHEDTTVRRVLDLIFAAVDDVLPARGRNPRRGDRPPAAATSTDRVDSATWLVAGTVVLGGIMTSIDTTVVNVALDSLARDFGVSVTSVQWVATGYLLALAIVIPLSGWATDRFGGKRVWVVSIGLFLAGSMLAGAAWSIGSLIFFRVLQGLGGGMIMPVGMTLITRAAGRGRWAASWASSACNSFWGRCWARSSVARSWSTPAGAGSSS